MEFSETQFPASGVSRKLRGIKEPGPLTAPAPACYTPFGLTQGRAPVSRIGVVRLSLVAIFGGRIIVLHRVDVVIVETGTGSKGWNCVSQNHSRHKHR